MRCQVCGAQTAKTVTDKREVNGGNVAGEEHLPPMIHHEHVKVALCDQHMREAKVIRNDELHEQRAKIQKALEAAQ